MEPSLRQDPLDNPALVAVLKRIAACAPPPPPQSAPYGYPGGGVYSATTSVAMQKEMKELFVGNILASGFSDQVLKDFLNAALRQVNLVTGPEDAISGIRLNSKFCFLEFRTPEDCSKALNLNGIPFMGSMLKIGRPAKYNGPFTSSKTWQEMTGQTVPTGVVPSSTVQTDPHTKSYREVFVGNISPEVTDSSLRDFINGAMQRMGLSNCDNESPIASVRVNPKFCFIEFKTIEDAANALNLNGIPFGGMALKISRPAKFEVASHITFYSWDDLLARWMTGELKVLTAGVQSRVLCITNMVTSEDLSQEDLFTEMIEDTKEECAQWGSVKSVVVPRPNPSGVETRGVGRLFVEMCAEEEAKIVLTNLKGRTFDGRTVDVKFYPQHAFDCGDYGMRFAPIVVSQVGLTTTEQLFPSLRLI